MAESNKKTRGKQIIEIKPIEKADDKMTTFSKRKSGIYKKASELSILTGADVGVLVFSPTGKPHSFAHPSIEAISNRFLGGSLPQNAVDHLFEAHRRMRIAKLNQSRNDLLHQLDITKEREKVLENILKGKETQGWWEAPVDKLVAEDLHLIDAALEDLIEKLNIKLNGGGGASSSSLPPTYIPNPECQFLDLHGYCFNKPNHDKS